MNICFDKDAAEKLERQAARSDKQPGLRIAYFEGDFADEVGLSNVGKVAWSLYERGLVLLMQKRISNEPRRYVYIAEVV